MCCTGKAIYRLRSLPLHSVTLLRCNMFTTPKALLTLSFLISLVNSTPRPSAEDLDPDFDDALNTNMFLDGISNSDDLVASAPLMNIFDSDPSIDANPLGDQGNLFAVDTSPGNSCSAEDSQSLPLIGRLRRREESPSGSGDGKFCISPTMQGTDETQDSFLLQLPKVDDWAAPELKSRRDICPIWEFGDRDIALCSAANTRVAPSGAGTKMIIVDHATFCTSSTDPGGRFSSPSVGVWLA